jgi:hypothetical protein
VGDQQHGQADHRQRDDQPPGEAGAVAGKPVVEARQGQHHADLHDLGRLHADRAELQPALCAQRDVAHHLHPDQQQQADGVDRVGDGEPDAQVDHGQHDHDDEADAEADQVVGRPGLPRAAGHREQHQAAGAGDQARAGQKVQSISAELDQQAVALAGPGQAEALMVMSALRAEERGSAAVRLRPAAAPRRWPRDRRARRPRSAPGRTTGRHRRRPLDAGADLGILEQGDAHDLARARGAGGGAAHAAVLDDDRDRIARLVDGREGDEQVVVLQAQRTERWARRARSVAAHLGRAGLAGHLDVAQAQLALATGACRAPVVGHGDHAASRTIGQVLGIERQVGHGGAAGLLHAADRLDQARQQRLLAVGDARGHHRQLQGLTNRVALADAQLGVSPGCQTRSFLRGRL